MCSNKLNVRLHSFSCIYREFIFPFLLWESVIYLLICTCFIYSWSYESWLIPCPGNGFLIFDCLPFDFVYAAFCLKIKTETCLSFPSFLYEDVERCSQYSFNSKKQKLQIQMQCMTWFTWEKRLYLSINTKISLCIHTKSWEGPTLNRGYFCLRDRLGWKMCRRIFLFIL